MIGKDDAPTQTDGFSCADWMSLSSIHVISENTRPSEAKDSFLSLKQSMKEKITEELVYSHRQLLAMLLFLGNTKLFDTVDIEAEARLTHDWECLRESALAAVKVSDPDESETAKMDTALADAAAASPAAAGARASMRKVDDDVLETTDQFLLRLDHPGDRKGEGAHDRAFQHFVEQNPDFQNCWGETTEMNIFRNCGFR